MLCGSERAAEQAAAIGIPRRILRVSGMILHPRFYAPAVKDRRSERMALGLDPDRPTGVVLFGGEGSDEMLKIARSLNNRSGVQLIFLCGRNEPLAEQLRAAAWEIPVHITGFTRNIPRYMELADFFIGKPGPGSISEALAKGLPVIVQRNARTMAHERYNAQWVEEQGVGIVVRSFAKDIRGAVTRLLQPDTYALLRSRAMSICNRAVYEIPELLDGILGSHGVVLTQSGVHAAD